MPLPTEPPQPLNVREIYTLLSRRRDAAFVCFWLRMLLEDRTCEILAVERRPASVQIAYSWRLSGDVVHATHDVLLEDLPDAEDATVSFGVTVHGDCADVSGATEPARLYDIPFFKDWRARWPQLPDGTPACDEGRR